MFFSQMPSEAIKNAIARVPGVTGVTAAAAAPTNYNNAAAQYQRPGGSTPVTLLLSPIDFNYFDFYRVKAVAGRLPSREARFFCARGLSPHRLH